MKIDSLSVLAFAIYVRQFLLGLAESILVELMVSVFLEFVMLICIHVNTPFEFKFELEFELEFEFEFEFESVSVLVISYVITI